MRETFPLIETAEESVPVHVRPEAGFDEWLGGQPAEWRRWLEATGFRPKPGRHALIPEDGGGIAAVVLITESQGPDVWTLAGLPRTVPEGTYRIEKGPVTANDAALGWAIGSYVFDAYKEPGRAAAQLLWPDGADRERVLAQARATGLVRDLINRPAGDLTPEALAHEAEGIASRHGARYTEIVGDDLLSQDFPSIYHVGKAAAVPPRLIDIEWGEASAPKVTLIGKGVTFDSGGLGIKPSGGMKLMKKDMGGAAHALGLAHVVMSLDLPVRLRVLIPAVENAISGNAYRPLDVIKTRSGKTVEIGHTDAEGRVIMADALTEAASEDPALIVDYATLTGAARAAVGTELAAYFTGDDSLAHDLDEAAAKAADPVWRLPLWDGYRQMVDGETADLTNSADSPYAGAITAALFLREFAGRDRPWVHFDIMAWNTRARPGRPKGGEAMGMRAMFEVLNEKFAGAAEHKK